MQRSVFLLFLSLVVVGCAAALPGDFSLTRKCDVIEHGEAWCLARNRPWGEL